ncbi:hypothetical protein AVEN_252707-1 [Araneus ventricosus]|uniref:Uncharacterized protein n=1 Tax=Araneus ventricosus TaxID=182803 RepID=A0A4Y2GN84_ARAVE|nr:hypothetical protein AVEN_252707-1 [Araneus ventricosus]
MIGSGGIQTNSKSKTSSADSNLGPRCEGSGKTKDLPTLGPRFEARNEIRNPRVGEEEGEWEEFCDFPDSNFSLQQSCKLAASLARQECKLETSYCK